MLCYLGFLGLESSRGEGVEEKEQKKKVKKVKKAAAPPPTTAGRRAAVHLPSPDSGLGGRTFMLFLRVRREHRKEGRTT